LYQSAEVEGQHLRPATEIVQRVVAHRGETSHLGPIFLTAGFALFALISVYLG
jgi:hypothetical protein